MHGRHRHGTPSGGYRFTGRQVTAMVTTVLVAIVLAPLGAKAAGSLVTIVDGTTTQTATVDPNGSLQVTNGKVPLDVVVRNSAFQPVQVRGVDDNSPYQSSGSVSFENGTSAEMQFRIVFPGTRLVIEGIMLNARGNFDRGMAVCTSVGGSTPVGMRPFRLNLPLERVNAFDFGGPNLFAANVAIRAYAPSESQVTCTFQFDRRATGVVGGTVTGYLTSPE
jgi:hypothetical protein